MEYNNKPKEWELLQKEVYETAAQYLPRLIKTAETVVTEFEGEEQEDTKDLFAQVVEGINWILETYNNSDSKLFRGDENGTKEDLEVRIQRLNNSITTKDKVEMSKALSEDMIPFLELYRNEIMEYLQKTGNIIS